MRLSAVCRTALALAVFWTACAAGVASAGHQGKLETVSPSLRVAAIRRAQVWMPTNVASMDLRAGPPDPGGFAPDALVSCDYVDRRLGGHSPKFSCSLGEHDDVKVKYGRTNGEVYAEVAATRGTAHARCCAAPIRMPFPSPCMSGTFHCRGTGGRSGAFRSANRRKSFPKQPQSAWADF